MSQFDIGDASTTEHVVDIKGKVLQIKCHVGLGDALVLQGMVQYFLLTAQYSRVIINTRERYLPDMKRLYHHIESSISFQVHEVYDTPPDDLPEADEIISTGFFEPNDDFDVPKWDREFYRHAKVPFINRWLQCYVPDSAEPFKPSRIKIRHHDPVRGYKIDMKPDRDIVDGARPDLLSWIPDLRSAAEIHCIDSCVLNLVESMYAYKMIRDEQKLFYHAYARRDPAPTLLAPWKVLR